MVVVGPTLSTARRCSGCGRQALGSLHDSEARRLPSGEFWSVLRSTGHGSVTAVFVLPPSLILAES